MPGTAPNGWQAPKTTWQATDGPTQTDFNRIEGNANATELGSRTVDPTQAPTSNAGTLRNLLDWLVNRIKAITGTTNWYDAPPISLTTLNAHKGRHATGGADAMTPADIGAVAASNGTASNLELSGVSVLASGGKVRGSGAGLANYSWLGFYENDKSTRVGMVGKGGSTTNDLQVLSDTGGVNLLPATGNTAKVRGYTIWDNSIPVSKDPPGYLNLPNGLVLMWDYVTIPVSAGGIGTATWTYPFVSLSAVIHIGVSVAGLSIGNAKSSAWCPNSPGATNAAVCATSEIAQTVAVRCFAIGY